MRRTLQGTLSAAGRFAEAKTATLPRIHLTDPLPPILASGRLAYKEQLNHEWTRLRCATPRHARIDTNRTRSEKPFGWVFLVHSSWLFRVSRNGVGDDRQKEMIGNGNLISIDLRRCLPASGGILVTACPPLEGSSSILILVTILVTILVDDCFARMGGMTTIPPEAGRQAQCFARAELGGD